VVQVAEEQVALVQELQEGLELLDKVMLVELELYLLVAVAVVQVR
jgi:hypothetical protein